MNVCHRYKLIWWATSRCASRYTSAFLSPLGFYNYDSNDGDVLPIFNSGLIFPIESGSEQLPFTHKLQVPLGFEDYDIIANIRNPYDTFYSTYRLQMMEYLRGKLQRDDIYDIPSVDDVEMSFEDWATAKFEYYDRIGWDIMDSVYELTTNNVKYLIRYENLNSDIMAIPEVSHMYDTYPLYKKIADDSLQSTKAEYRDSLVLKYETFQDVYTQKIADSVYRFYKPQFDLFNYNRDSWKK